MIIDFNMRAVYGSTFWRELFYLTTGGSIWFKFGTKLIYLFSTWAINFLIQPIDWSRLSVSICYLVVLLFNNGLSYLIQIWIKAYLSAIFLNCAEKFLIRSVYRSRLSIPICRLFMGLLFGKSCLIQQRVDRFGSSLKQNLFIYYILDLC